MDKLIIEVAVNETTTRADNPNVPLTPEELARDVAECVDAGASIVHFHPRDPLCPPDKLDIARLGDVAFYKEAIGLMKERCDVIPYPTYPYQTHDGHDGVAGLFPHVQALRADPEVNLETFVFFIGAANMGWWDEKQARFATDTVNYMLHEEAVSFLRWSARVRPGRAVRRSRAWPHPAHLPLPGPRRRPRSGRRPPQLLRRPAVRPDPRRQGDPGIPGRRSRREAPVPVVHP